MPARLALLAAALLLAAGLACCRREEPVAKAPEKPSPFFQVRDGKLERLEPVLPAPRPDTRPWWRRILGGPAAPRPVKVLLPAETPALPWTVQARVADMAEAGGAVYLALNGSGLASVDLKDPGQPGFAYHPDRLIFRGRTVSAILPSGGSLLCHLYYNATLNTVEAKDLGLRPVGLVSFDPSIREYRFHTPSLQWKDPSWEPVGLAPLASGGFLLEWKAVQGEDARFEYTRLGADRKNEEKAARTEYMAAMEPVPCGSPKVPPALRSLFDAALRELAGAGVRAQGAAVDFLVRGPGETPPARYRDGNPAGGILHAPVWGAGSEWTALLPDGSLLAVRIGAEPARIALPAPPESCAYTGLLVHAGTALVSWEQGRFTDVGAAGLLVLPLSAP